MLIDELNARLVEARKAYYAGEPIMSDGEYDALEAQLAGMVHAHPELAAAATVLTTVGSDLDGAQSSLFGPAESGSNPDVKAAATLGRIPHRVPMLSIENKYTFEEMVAWANSVQATLGLADWPAFTIEPKYDGVSESLDYDGTLIQALTRGDGTAGESVLEQIRTSSTVPSRIPDHRRINVRGEALIAASTLKALNDELEANGAKPYSTTRNLAAGTLKLQDIEEVTRRKLLFQPWDVLLPEDGPDIDSGYQRLKMIEQWGFAPYTGRIVTTPDELRAAMDEMLPTLQAPDQEIAKDGLVLKVDSFAHRQRLGVSTKYSNFTTCFKPQNMRADTVVRSVQWQVGRQGKVTPVATVEAVILGGVKIEKATLNNLSWLQALGVRIGSAVSLVRSGDVIPKIVEVLDSSADTMEILPPADCPECGLPTIMDTDEEAEGSSIAIVCRNPECPGRLREMLTYVADRTVLEVDALGPELAGKLVDLKLVSNLADLFAFGNMLRAQLPGRVTFEAPPYLVERGFPVVLTLRMMESLESAKTAPWDRWIAAFCIPMVGRRLGRVLAKTLRLQPDDLPRLADKLSRIQVGEIEGLGTSKLGAIHSYARNPEWVQMLVRLHEHGVRPAATVAAQSAGGQTLTGVSFVLTGEFEQFGTREEITAKLEALGAVAKSGVSKNVTHLLVGTSPGKSKLTKAEQLGIQQYGADWLAEVLI